MWTLTEVMNLVDGISEYGVGRWTDIKRLLFAASAYRTPIDLRVQGNSLPIKVLSLFSNIDLCSLLCLLQDKWRNLLRASCAHKLKKKEVSCGFAYIYFG